MKDLDAAIEEFNTTGYVVVPDALSPERVDELNRAVDRYLQRYPPESDEWIKDGATSIQARDLLPKTEDFDFAIENPVILGFARRYFGDNVTFEHLSIVIRKPERNPTELKGWHRDNTRDYDRRAQIGAISAIYYLTDVSERDHCFSIVPETHNRLVDMRPEDVRPGSERDILGPRGTAILFHARCLHSGRVKPDSRERRTLHVYYWDTEQPRTSTSSTIPPRLYTKEDPALPPKFYSKWNVTDVLDAIGRK